MNTPPSAPQTPEGDPKPTESYHRRNRSSQGARIRIKYGFFEALRGGLTQSDHSPSGAPRKILKSTSVLKQRIGTVLRAGMFAGGVGAAALTGSQIQFPYLSEKYEQAALALGELEIPLKVSSQVIPESGISQEEALISFLEERFPSGFTVHEITSGETLGSIGGKYGISVPVLFWFNNIIGKTIGGNLQRPLITAGEKLVIPKSSQEAAENTGLIKALGAQHSGEHLHPKSYFTPFFPVQPAHLGWDKIVSGYAQTFLQGFVAQHRTHLESASVASSNNPDIPSNYALWKHTGVSITDVRMPRALDIINETSVSCASFIRSIMRQSVNMSEIPGEWRRFFSAQNIDAWELGAELIALGFEQRESDLMKFFESNRLTHHMPIDPKNRKDYIERVNEVYRKLPEAGVGTVIPMFFTYSGYKGVMAEEARIRKRRGLSPHYNTHQTVYAGHGAIELTGGDVPRFANGSIRVGDRPVKNWLADFIVARLDFGGSRQSAQVYSEVLQGIDDMAALIEISIDGEVFSLKENNTNLKTITDQTLVTLGGPLVLDGEHKDALGTLTSAPETWYARDRNGRMTARIRFAWEMSLYLMTEILVPKKTLPIIESKNDILAKFGLAIGSVYDIRRSHQYPRSSDIHDPCDRNELVGHSETVEGALWKHYCTLNPNASSTKELGDLRKKFQREIFGAQLKGLQMLGFIQHAGEINRGALPSNRVVPYFVSREGGSIDDIFSEYTRQRLVLWRKENAATPVGGEYIPVFTLPGQIDTWKRILGEITAYSSLHTSTAQIGERIQHLTQSQSRVLFRQLMRAHGKSAEEVDRFFGNVPSYELLLFDKKIIEELLNSIDRSETIYDSLGDPLMGGIIKSVVGDPWTRRLMVAAYRSENDGSYPDTAACIRGKGWSNITKCILTREGAKYTVQRLDTLSEAVHMNGTFITSSIGDYQFRLTELEKWAFSDQPWDRNAQGERIIWPQRRHLIGAIEQVLNPQYHAVFSALEEPERTTANQDRVIAEEIQTLLHKEYLSGDERKRLVAGLRRICRITRNGADGVVGRIVSTYLMVPKIASHITHFGGVFERVRREKELEHILSAEEPPYPARLPWPTMSDYERMILSINNQGEINVVLFMTQIYIARLVEVSTGMYYAYPSIYADSMIGELLGKTEYTPGVFRKHISGLREALIQRIHTVQNHPELVEQSQNTVKTIGSDVLYIAERLKELEESENILRSVYGILRDEKLRSILARNGYPTTLIPSHGELFRSSFDGEQVFQRAFLGYAQKSIRD